MKIKLYNILVNRQSGIRERYHRMHDGTTGIRRLASWLYLLWLNLCYYIFGCRFPGRTDRTIIYEEKRIPFINSESEEACKRFRSSILKSQGISTRSNAAYSDSILQLYINYLLEYDVISFDLFDTLIFRPFSAPTDLFFLLGEKLDFQDFKRIRIETETKARQEKYLQTGSFEVTLSDIWRLMERETGLNAKTGEDLECAMEKELCYANPFMQKVFEELCKSGKIIYVSTDMYLPQDCIRKILERNGYDGIAQLYVSSEYGNSKYGGGLYNEILKDAEEKLGREASVIHVGDNPYSDVKMAKKHGISALHYPNADSAASVFRAQDMSPVIGGAYRGIVNHLLYSGFCSRSMEYEYGFIYGGLFAVGYCVFIHNYIKQNNVDRILFLSRDGDILKQVYDFLYPCADTQYVYWSRAAALKLTADENRYDFFRRFLHHKVNKGKSISDILKEMELGQLIEKLSGNNADENEKPELQPSKKGYYNILKIIEDELTDENVELVKEFLLDNWVDILSIYGSQSEAAGRYYAKMLEGCRRTAAVDIGWAGSGAMALRTLIKKWRIPCELIGILAGTNGANNPEPEMAEAQLQSGKLISYMFSQSINRDMFKKHDPAVGDNVYWELLLSSPTRQFIGFYPSESGIALRFGAMPVNIEGCMEIQRGIMDFAREYKKHFGNYSYMFRISGRDACAPMLAAYSHNRKYLKAVAARFNMDIEVSCVGETVDRIWNS